MDLGGRPSWAGWARADARLARRIAVPLPPDPPLPPRSGAKTGGGAGGGGAETPAPDGLQKGQGAGQAVDERTEAAATPAKPAAKAAAPPTPPTQSPRPLRAAKEVGSNSAPGDARDHKAAGAAAGGKYGDGQLSAAGTAASRTASSSQKQKQKQQAVGAPDYASERLDRLDLDARMGQDQSSGRAARGRGRDDEEKEALPTAAVNSSGADRKAAVSNQPSLASAGEEVLKNSRPPPPPPLKLTAHAFGFTIDDEGDEVRSASAVRGGGGGGSGGGGKKPSDDWVTAARTDGAAEAGSRASLGKARKHEAASSSRPLPAAPKPPTSTPQHQSGGRGLKLAARPSGPITLNAASQGDGSSISPNEGGRGNSHNDSYIEKGPSQKTKEGERKRQRRRRQPAATELGYTGYVEGEEYYQNHFPDVL